MDWPSVLGVAVDATPEQIKSAFRRLSLEHHPDRGGDAERYRVIVEAYEAARQPPAKKRPGAAPTRGRSVFERLRLTVFQSVRGGGFVVRDVKVTVPAGVKPGQRLRVSGGGEAGSHGGAAGDLLIEVVVTPDPWWIRDDPALIHRLRVSWLEAYRGDAVILHTPWGERTLKLRAGSQHGERITCPDYGISGGDLIVILELVAPLPGQRAIEAALEGAVFPG